MALPVRGRRRTKLVEEKSSGPFVRVFFFDGVYMTCTPFWETSRRSRAWPTHACSMPKVRFSSLDVAAIVSSLRSTVLGYRISNVYDINPRTYLLKLAKVLATQRRPVAACSA